MPTTPDPGAADEAAEPTQRQPAADERRALARAWLSGLDPALGIDPDSLRPASSDASFRRYFRVDCRAAPSLIVMDAPPAHEDCRPFVRAAGLLAARGVHTPRIAAADLDAGLLLLSDLGPTTYAQAMEEAPEETGRLYRDALAALLRLQRPPANAPDPAAALPPYDRGRLLNEMRLFPEWYVARHLKVELDARELALLEALFERLVEAALAQARVLVHRDYHCRNLMRVDADARLPGPDGKPIAANPGVLDFQDAVYGPITYDLVSLLRDAYVEWPEDRQIDWAARYWEQAREARLPVPERFDAYWRDLEWMGLQRSLKVLGIFARLCYRDGKQRYLADLPLVLRHTQRVAERYDAFAGFARLLDRVHQRTPVTGFTF
jgi:hypothetical protein